MFYRMINTKRDEWFNSSECTVRDIIDYMRWRKAHIYRIFYIAILNMNSHNNFKKDYKRESCV